MSLALLKRVRVEGRSMEPTLRAGQRLLVATRAYRARGPQRGDLVVVRHPQRDLKLVKRVAAVPGDVWQGRALGPDEYAVRGDNPDASTDSGHWGPLPRAAFVGRVLVGYRPVWRVR